MKLHKLLLTALTVSLLFTGCSNDDDAPQLSTPVTGEYEDGLFILNEGNFGGGNSEVSFLSYDMQLENGIFSGINQDMELGDTGQSIGFYGNNAYIVMNNSQAVQIVNRYTFAHLATIAQGFSNPRFIAFAGNKAYVTNWGDGTNPNDDYIAVVDLGSNTVMSTIPVAEGPEKIIENNGKLYVAHKGGYGYGNTVTVINTATNTVQTSVTVGDVPNSMEIYNEKLYVLNSGKPSWAGTQTNGELSIINLDNNTVDRTLEFNEYGPSNLDIEGSSVFYTLDSRIYKMDVAATSLPSAPLFTTSAQGAYGIYSFAVHNGKIYLGDALDFNSAGKVHVHDLSGGLLNSFTVGVIPTGFYFN